MKKLLSLMTGVLAIGLLWFSASRVYATCAATDVECYTVGGTQVYKLDSSGNQTVGGTSTITGASTVGGALSVTGASTVGTFQVFTPTTVNVAAATQILPTSSYINLTSTASFTLTGTPAISTATSVGGTTAWADGTFLVIRSTQANLTITFPVDVGGAGSRVIFSSASTAGIPLVRVVNSTNTLSLIYSATVNRWIGL